MDLKSNKTFHIVTFISDSDSAVSNKSNTHDACQVFNTIRCSSAPPLMKSIEGKISDSTNNTLHLSLRNLSSINKAVKKLSMNIESLTEIINPQLTNQQNSKNEVNTWHPHIYTPKKTPTQHLIVDILGQKLKCHSDTASFSIKRLLSEKQVKATESFCLNNAPVITSTKISIECTDMEISNEEPLNLCVTKFELKHQLYKGNSHVAATYFFVSYINQIILLR